MDTKCNGTLEQDEDDYALSSPMNSNGISIRKRVKLHGQASDDRGLVNPPFVPKKLRSAINKRNSKPTLPSSSDSKRRQHHAFNGTPLFVNLADKFTKDEEEVAEALISISSVTIRSNSTEPKEDLIKLGDNSDTKAICFPPLEVPKEEREMSLIPCSIASSCIGEQHATTSISQKFAQPESIMKLSPNVEPVEHAMNLSNHLGGSHQYIPVNGTLQPTQLVTPLVQKQEIELWPIGPAKVEQNMQILKQKNGYVTHDVNQEAPIIRLGLQSSGHEPMTMPPSCNAGSYTNTVLGRATSANLNSLPMEKLSLASTDMKRPWNRCTAHVYIAHLICNHQKKGTKQLPMLQVDQLKEKVEASHSIPMSANANGSRIEMITPPSLSLLDKNNEARNLMYRYTLQKGSENSRKGNVPYTPNQAMPFNISQGSYPSQLREQLATGSAQQVQLQHLPQYITNSQLHQQQQQQMLWQAHLAQYRQNGRQYNSSSSSSSHILNHQPPPMFPLGPNYNPHNLQQFVLPVSSPSLSSRSKPHQMISNVEGYR